MFPMKQFHLVAVLIYEDVYVAIRWAFAKFIDYYAAQSVEAFSHVTGSMIEVITLAITKAKHSTGLSGR